MIHLRRFRQLETVPRTFEAAPNPACHSRRGIHKTTETEDLLDEPLFEGEIGFFAITKKNTGV